MIWIILEMISLLIVGQLIVFVFNQYYQRLIVCKDIPGLPFYPIVGNLFHVTNDPQEMIPHCLQTIKKYGKVVQIWVGHIHYIATTDIRIVEKVLSSTKNIRKYHAAYRFSEPWLGNGLASNKQPESWRKMRKLLTPAFHFTILEESLRVFDSLVDLFLNNIKEHLNGEPFDLHPHVAYYTLDVICEAAMGVKMNVQIDSTSPYVQAIEKLLVLITKRAFSPIHHFDFTFQFTKTGREHNRCLDAIHGIVNKVIEERRVSRQINPEDVKPERKHKAFLDLLLDCTIDGRPLTDIEIRDEVNTFMFGGYETVSTTASFLFYELANHPDIQKKLFNEIETELGNDRQKPLTITNLNKLKYLEAVIKETLRMYPPGILLPRELDEDLVFDDIKIPAGRGILLLTYAIHHDPENFPDPESFKPERFLDENVNRNPFTFIPFSAGPRNCIGQKYAMCGLKFIVVKFLQNYELLSAGVAHKIKLSVAVALVSLNGMFVRVKRRNYTNI